MCKFLLCNQLIKPFQWCSLCSDIRPILVLCVGCRVGICMASPGSTSACLKWCRDVEEREDFIFECPYCARARGQAFKVSTVFSNCVTSDHLPQFFYTSQTKAKEKDEVWFCQDSPVLLISAAWHQKEFRFVKMLHGAFNLAYHNPNSSVGCNSCSRLTLVY